MLRVAANPELRKLLAEIDACKVGLRPVQTLSPAEREAWARAYAEDAARHGANLDATEQR